MAKNFFETKNLCANKFLDNKRRATFTNHGLPNKRKVFGLKTAVDDIAANNIQNNISSSANPNHKGLHIQKEIHKKIDGQPQTDVPISNKSKTMTTELFGLDLVSDMLKSWKKKCKMVEDSIKLTNPAKSSEENIPATKTIGCQVDLSLKKKTEVIFELPTQQINESETNPKVFHSEETQKIIYISRLATETTVGDVMKQIFRILEANKIHISFTAISCKKILNLSKGASFKLSLPESCVETISESKLWPTSTLVEDSIPLPPTIYAETPELIRKLNKSKVQLPKLTNILWRKDDSKDLVNDIRGKQLKFDKEQL